MLAVCWDDAEIVVSGVGRHKYWQRGDPGRRIDLKRQSGVVFRGTSAQTDLKLTDSFGAQFRTARPEWIRPRPGLP